MGSVTFKPATLLKVTLLHGCFSRFLNCSNGTKSPNASQIISETQFLFISAIYIESAKLFTRSLVNLSQVKAPGLFKYE